MESPMESLLWDPYDSKTLVKENPGSEFVIVPSPKVNASKLVRTQNKWKGQKIVYTLIFL